MSNKCKGTGKAKGFGCGEEVSFTHRNGIKSYNRRYGLGYSCKCYFKWLSSQDLTKTIAKAKNTVEAKKKAESRQKKLDSRNFNKLTTENIQHIARLIDSGLPCLATGVHANQIHGGHIFGKGAHAECKHNLHNIHRQGARSNKSQVDDAKMVDGCIDEYGMSYFEFVRGLKNKPIAKLPNMEWKEKYKITSDIINRLKRTGAIFTTPKQRVIARNKLNLEIGIYEQGRCVYLQ